MAKVLVTEDYLSDIGDAIRGKLGGSNHYTPGQMASAISSIPTEAATLISKTIASNGTYNASSDQADGYNSVSVNVPNSYSAQDEGKVVNNGTLVAQESQNISQNGTYDTTLKDQVVVSVPNSYSVSDEGKVVSQGTLVSQGSDTVTQNKTYDTTLISSLTVNVSGGGGISKETLMTQGQVSTTSTYATANFDDAIDFSEYDIIVVYLWRGGDMIGKCGAVKTQDFSIYGSDNRAYDFRITTTTISCTKYSGNYVNLYVDVYGYKESGS